MANNLLNGCRDKHVTIHCHLEHTCFSTCCRPSQRRQLTGQKHACANGQGDKHIRIDKETVRQARGKLRYRGTKENARMFHISSKLADSSSQHVTTLELSTCYGSGSDASHKLIARSHRCVTVTEPINTSSMTSVAQEPFLASG